MINTLKMDLYRFFRSVALYVILGIIFITTAMVIYSFNLTTSPAIAESGIELPAEFLELLPHSVDGYFDGIFQGNFLVLFSVIFTVVFANAEFKNGFIKNIAALVPNRITMVFSKLLVILLAIIMFHAITVLCLIAGCCGIIGMREVDNPGGIVVMVLMSIFMNWALSALTYMIFMFARKSILPMVSSIVYVLMGSSAYMLINLIIEKAFGATEFAIEKYTVMGNMLYFVNSHAESADIIRSLVVTTVVTAVSVVVSCVLMKKKDI